MDTVSLSKSLTAASANCVALAQTVVAAGKVILNGGSVSLQSAGPFGANVSIAVLDTQRRIAIISSGNDSTTTAHIYGNRQGGQPINEILALTNAGTATSVLDYLNVAAVTLSAPAAANVTIGSSATGSTDWIMPNFHLTPFNVGIVTEVSSSPPTYAIETTNDRYFGPNDPTLGTTPQPHVLITTAGTTVGETATLTSAVTGFRFTITAGTGTLSVQSTQSGIINGS